jgi:hypothetical protein
MTIISVILLMCLNLGASSQNQYHIHLGTAIPISNFALYGMNDIMSDPTVGINIGWKYLYRFTDKGIGVFAGIDFMYNGISKEYKEEVEKWPDFLWTDPPKYHAYYNIPISTGISYDFRLNDNLFLSCNAGITVNSLLISDLDIGIYKNSSNPALGLGGKIGVSLIIKNRVSINLDYLGLGSHTVLCESMTGLTQYKEEWSQDLNLHMLTFTMGIVL